jgi:surface polysaccharide O-acyltransferase-like enzyme
MEEDFIENACDKPSRQYYFDHIRTFFCILLIFFHTARGFADWWFVILRNEDTTPILTPLISFFFATGMNAFLFMAGYFTPSSYEINGGKKFWKNKRIKLWYPLLFYSLVMPFVMYYNFQRTNSYAPVTFWFYFVNYYLGLGDKPVNWASSAWPEFTFGHMWFNEYLLIFSAIYVIGYKLSRKYRNNKGKTNNEGINPEGKTKFPKLYSIISFILILSFFVFLIRIDNLLSAWTTIFVVVQITYAHVIYYVVFFFLGVKAYRENWVENIPVRAGKAWFYVAIALMIFINIINIYMPLSDTSMFSGGTVQSFFYALWETAQGISMLIGLLYLGKKYFNKHNKFTKFLAKHTYLVYIIHAGIVMIFQSIFMNNSVPPITSWFFVSLITIFLSFLIAFLLRKIPYFKKNY